jgi:hypothetical protein
LCGGAFERQARSIISAAAKGRAAPCPYALKRTLNNQSPHSSKGQSYPEKMRIKGTLAKGVV